MIRCYAPGGTHGQVVQIINLQTGSVANTLRLDDRSSTELLTFNFGRSDEGRLVAVGTTSGDVYLWNPMQSEAEKVPGNVAVNSLVFSRDGTYLAIGREDGSISIRDLVTKRTIELAHAHSGPVTGLRFGFGGRWLSSLSFDAVSSLWTVDRLTKLDADLPRQRRIFSGCSPLPMDFLKANESIGKLALAGRSEDRRYRSGRICLCVTTTGRV